MVLFFSLVSQHPRQARQIKAKEAEILGLWNGLKVGNPSLIKLQVPYSSVIHLSLVTLVTETI